MPVGYLLAMAVPAVCVAYALAPPHPRHSHPWRVSFLFGHLVNEVPFLTFFWLVVATALAAAQGQLATPVGVVGAGLAVATTIGLSVVVRRGLRARPALDAALATGLGPAVAPTGGGRLSARCWLRVVVWPFPWWFRPGIARSSGIAYGPGGRHHRLDVYRSRRRPPTGSILIHLHGGGFRTGSRRLEGRPLINRLARHGWVCISADYRIGRDVAFPDQLVDVKGVIAWAKAHAADFGADPTMVVLAGSSAGGHLAATAALTPDQPRFQPGFEAADTTVLAAIGLYGYYGPIVTAGPPSSPHDHITAEAPPIAVIHGDRDTLVIVEDARAFAHDLRDRSQEPVVYAELPGAQHGFDVFHSIRFEAVIDAVETFTTAITVDRHGQRDRAP